MNEYIMHPCFIVQLTCVLYGCVFSRTKKRKVYVVSTTKRPVPLEHHLYTGNSNKTSNELFMIVDSKKTFVQAGYNELLMLVFL